MPAVLETDGVPWKMHHWADVSDMLSTFFFGRTTKPLVFSFYCPQQVTVCRLWFLLFVFPFFCVFSFYFCLGISWLLGSRSKLICNDTLSAAVPRGFPALENRRRIFWGVVSNHFPPSFPWVYWFTWSTSSFA